MGSNYIEGILDSGIDENVALAIHLSSNHYPPIPAVMIGPCKEAIANANAGDWYAPVELPEGILWRGESSCPTHALVEHAHLDCFIQEVSE